MHLGHRRRSGSSTRCRAVTGKVMLLTPSEPVRRRNHRGAVQPVEVEARHRTCPCPQELYTAFWPAVSAGESAMIAPGLRSRLGQPSSRCADPGGEGVVHRRVTQRAGGADAGERVLPFTVSTVPFSPTTAFSLSSATVVAGSVRLIAAVLDALHHRGGQRVGIHLEPHG